MKKVFFIALCLSFSSVIFSQIIADHTVVDKYDDIPQYYIDQVKKMWLVYAGESHSRGVMRGLQSLASANPKYAANWINGYSGMSPEAYTDDHLRVSRATWGDVDTYNEWVWSYGEEDWWTTSAAIAQTKAGITYCHNNNLEISVFSFGHCYDAGVNYTDYCNATQQYIDYCKTNGYNTKVIFSTNTVDAAASGTQYTRTLGANLIRNFVAEDPSRILFDYADILCYDDGSEVMNVAYYNDTPYQMITPTNELPDLDAHISAKGEERLAKAMWWLLARIAGWDGN